jgi:hypothetical protein
MRRVDFFQSEVFEFILQLFLPDFYVIDKINSSTPKNFSVRNLLHFVQLNFIRAEI